MPEVMPIILQCIQVWLDLISYVSLGLVLLGQYELSRHENVQRANRTWVWANLLNLTYFLITVQIPYACINCVLLILAASNMRT